MSRWFTGFALLVVTALPAAAIERGPCRDGAMWWSIGQVAGFGPCESPEEGFLVLSCGSSGATMELDMPFGIEVGEVDFLTLDIDGTAYRLRGEGTFYPRSDTVGAGGIDLTATELAALSGGALARITVAGNTRRVHLSGSRNAITALQAACGG